ncbi:MAG: NADH-quinone oxidoreductase subunit J [Peptococcaceae bacterium]|nr:MAG: NADH-quinone oxidoreductase subunit J [Peptococcaceae bacterium]
MDNIFSIAAFYLLGLVILGSALLVVMLKNLVHCVLWLAVTFIAVAGLYMLLDADFLAVVQILVYAGAICIMMVFAVMLTQRKDMKSSSLFNTQFRSAGLVAFLTAALSAYLAMRTAWTSTVMPVPPRTAEAIATLMLTKYVVPFEVAALLLLVALIGAIILAKEVKADD